MKLATTVSDTMSQAGRGYLSSMSKDTGADMLCVRNDSRDPTVFAAAVGDACAEWDGRIILETSDPSCAEAGLRVCGTALLLGANAYNVDAFAAVASDRGCALAVRGATLEDAVALVAVAEAAGVTDMILDPGISTLAGCLDAHVAMERAAADGFGPAAFPLMIRTGSGEYAVALAALSAIHGGGLAVFDGLQPYEAAPLRALEMEFRTGTTKL